MESMRNRMRSRRLRGLVLHHRRHPSAHPRRLVTRTASWGEPPVRGVCRWCHAPPPPYTSHGTTTASRPTASHQDRSPSASRSRCARATAVLPRSSTTGSRSTSPGRWDPRRSEGRSPWRTSSGSAAHATGRKTRLDRRLARFLSACSLDWRGARRAWRVNRGLGGRVPRASRDS